jgi:hypothetical protein
MPTASDKSSAPVPNPKFSNPKIKDGASSSTGIAITVANLQPDAVNTITADASFIGRAVLMPPGSVAGVANSTYYCFVAYVCPCMGSIQLYIPNVSGILFADLPNGILPPDGYVNPDGSAATIFDAITAAIQDWTGPTDPTGTGNGH